MKRRSFLKSIASALISVQVAVALGAEIIVQKSKNELFWEAVFKNAPEPINPEAGRQLIMQKLGYTPKLMAKRVIIGCSMTDQEFRTQFIGWCPNLE